MKGGLGRTFYAPILDAARRAVRYDPGCMSQPAGTKLIGADLIDEFVQAATATTIEWTESRTLVVDNWRVLHGRPAVKTADTSRTLMRTLVA